MKLCPKCGSVEIVPVIGGIIGTWKCEKCGFSGTIFPDVEKLKDKKKKVRKKREEVKKSKGKKGKSKSEIPKKECNKKC